MSLEQKQQKTEIPQSREPKNPNVREEVNSCIKGLASTCSKLLFSLEEKDNIAEDLRVKEIETREQRDNLEAENKLLRTENNQLVDRSADQIFKLKTLKKTAKKAMIALTVLFLCVIAALVVSSIIIYAGNGVLYFCSIPTFVIIGLIFLYTLATFLIHKENLDNGVREKNDNE